MIELNAKGHTVSFDGTTVKEVLDEIREFAKDKNAHYIGDGFGNPDSKSCDCWSISIDGITYWNNWKKQFWNTYRIYDHSLDDLVVDKVLASGGWYCFYNFKIYTKDKSE